MQSQNTVSIVVIAWQGRLIENSVAGGHINISTVVDCRRAASGPNAAIGPAQSVRRGIENGGLSLHIRSTISDHPAVVGSGIFVRGKRYVYVSVGQRQSGPVVMQLRVEADHATGGSVAGSRYGRRNRYRCVELFASCCEVECMQSVIKRAGIAGAPGRTGATHFRRADHIDRIRRGINNGCSRDPDLRIDVAVAVSHLIPDHGVLARGAAMKSVEQLGLPVCDAWTRVGVESVDAVVRRGHE